MDFLRTLFPRRQTRQEAERAYLDGAANRYDLEQREREIDRGRFAGY